MRPTDCNTGEQCSIGWLSVSGTAQVDAPFRKPFCSGVRSSEDVLAVVNLPGMDMEWSSAVRAICRGLANLHVATALSSISAWARRPKRPQLKHATRCSCAGLLRRGLSPGMQIGQVRPC